MSAYRLIGYDPEIDYSFIETNRKLRKQHPEIVASVVRQIQELGAVATLDEKTGLLHLNQELRVSIVLCRHITTDAGASRWLVRLDEGLKPDITIAARMDATNEGIRDYYLLPGIDMTWENLRLAEENGVYLDALPVWDAGLLFRHGEARKTPGGCMNNEIIMIPIERIRVLNPRPRDKKKFEQIIQSIKNLGLKKPIQVSLRSAEEGTEPGYDLVCGQGRMEAFLALGHKEIPAIVVEVSREERLLRSLVENMARRLPSRLALMNEIERLKADGYSNVEIGKKLDIADGTVGGYIALKKAGEERLLDAAINGKIPLGVAMDIAKADSPELQRELLKGFESKELNQFAIRTVKRLIDQRRFVGKGRDTEADKKKSRTNADSLINAFKRESQKQRLMVKKARLCDAKLVITVTALGKLLGDENFFNLLRAESLADIPQYLQDKLAAMKKEAA